MSGATDTLRAFTWIELALGHLDLARPVDTAILHSAMFALFVMLGDVTAARPHLDALAAAAAQATGDELLLIGDEFAGNIAPTSPSAHPELLRELARRATEIADRTGDANSALLARVATLRPIHATPTSS